jgi:hypothetical protein
MPLTRTRLSFIFADETEEVIETKLYHCAADEIAFERHYGFTYSSTLPFGAYAALEAVGHKVADLDPESRSQLAGRKNEHPAFFSWRCWSRTHPDTPRKFEEFIESLASLDIDDMVETDALDPTAATPALSGG